MGNVCISAGVPKGIGSIILPVAGRRSPMPISSALSRAQQPGPSGLPSTRFLIQNKPKHPLIPMSSSRGNIRRSVQWNCSTVWLGLLFQGDGTIQSSLGHPILPPVDSSNAHPSLQHHSTVVPDPPLQAVHHLNTQYARFILANVCAITSPPIRESSKHSNASTHPLPAHHGHHPSLPSTLNDTHPHFVRIAS